MLKYHNLSNLNLNSNIHTLEYSAIEHKLRVIYNQTGTILLETYYDPEEYPTW